MPVAARRIFETDAIHRRDEAAIRDRVAALHRFPGGMLRARHIFLFRPDASRSRSDKKVTARRASAVSRAASGYH